MWVNSRRLIAVTWRRWPGLVGVSAGLTVATALMPFVSTAATALLINSVVRGIAAHHFTITHQQVVYLAILLLARFVPNWLNTLFRFVDARLYAVMDEWAQLSIVEKAADLDIARQEDKEFADLANRVSDNVYRVMNFLTRAINEILDNSIGVIVACIVLGFSQWAVLLTIIIATIPELTAESRYGATMWNIHSAKAEVRRRFYRFRGHFYDVSDLTELKLFQNVGYFLNIIRELFLNFQNDQIQAERHKRNQRLLTQTISQSAMGFALVWFVLQVIHGDMQIGTFTFLVASVGQLRGSLSGFFAMIGQQYQDSLFITDFFRYMDARPVIVPPEHGLRLDPEVTPEIEFRNVTFTYPESALPVFKNFSLRIPAGRKVAIVGVNGAGKTTLIKLLCRFYDPQEGRILVGGHDLREIDLESWYYMIGALFQDYSRYHLTVRDAIAVGRTGTEPDIEKVKEVAKAAEADAFIDAWEKSYEQQLGKNFTEGVEPSVGQWQKLALARTFYRNPRVLILDEPTSSIDAEAEAKIFESIEALPSDRTTFMISHRFSTVRKADEIIVIENGRLLEQGDHESLIARGGTYARLFHLQAKGYQA